MSNQDKSIKDETKLAQATVSETEEIAASDERTAETVEVMTETPVEILQQELEQVREELQTVQNDALRTQAEMINIRRRAEQDVAKAHKFGQEKLVNELLPVLDNLGRAISTSDDDNANVQVLREGVKMTQKMLADGLARFSVKEIDPMGQPFDPTLHQAMTMIANADVEPNTVVEVLHKGYSLNGRLVRPAMVIVSKA
jgi:molecular chaperone GrpE